MTNGAHTIKLTRRLREILNLAADGLTSQEIADRLYVSKRTIDFHFAELYDRLSVNGSHVNNRTRALNVARGLGLIGIADDSEENGG